MIFDTPPTPQAVDASIAALSNDDLIAIVNAAGPLPMAEWTRLTAQQRRAMRAGSRPGKGRRKALGSP